MLREQEPAHSNEGNAVLAKCSVLRTKSGFSVKRKRLKRRERDERERAWR